MTHGPSPAHLKSLSYRGNRTQYKPAPDANVRFAIGYQDTAPLETGRRSVNWPRCFLASGVVLAIVFAVIVPVAAQDREAFLAKQTIHCPRCALGGTNLERRDLTGADLSGADLRDAKLSRTILRNANLSGANLSETNLKRRDLTGANLSGANLTGVSFHRAILRGANLSGADLTEANLNLAVLTAANVQRAVLKEALLYQIDAGGADL